MNEPASWQSIRDDVLRRIHGGIWLPGQAIPNEADLATEFGCARTTVNRALRSLAEDGLLNRKRKAGTRVAEVPIRRAQFAIPVIRGEIEGRGDAYGYRLLSSTQEMPPALVKTLMNLQRNAPLLHLKSLHLSNNRPHVFEDRWINPDAVPGIDGVDFAAQSANEYLVRNVPFWKGDISLSAVTATSEEASVLQTEPGAALFQIERTTWTAEKAITVVRLVYAPGYTMNSML